MVVQAVPTRTEQVRVLAATGMSPWRIAEQLGVSRSTVRVILKKLKRRGS